MSQHNNVLTLNNGFNFNTDGSNVMWYYQDKSGQQHGPLSSDDLIQNFQQGILNKNSLIRHADKLGWQPLDVFAVQLGIPRVLTNHLPEDADAKPILSPEYRKKTSEYFDIRAVDCHIFESKKKKRFLRILFFVLFVFIIMIIFLIKMIIPSTQDLYIKKKINNIMVLADSLEMAVEAHISQEKRCPTYNDQGFSPSSEYAEPSIKKIDLYHLPSGECVVKINLNSITDTQKTTTADNSIILRVNPNDTDFKWNCETTLAAKYIPDCRNLH